MIVFEHTVPAVLIWLGIIAGLGAGAYSVWRWGPRNMGMWIISGLFAAFLALLLWCLLIPGTRHTETRTLKPRFVVALDRSKSMLLKPGEDAETPHRWDRAMAFLEMPWLRYVAAECEVDVYTFDAEVSSEMTPEEAMELEPEGDGTLLRDALRKITSRYNGMNVAGGVLLSDGIDTREAFDDWAAQSRPFKLYTLQLEDDAAWEQDPDLRIEAVRTPKRVTVGWQTELKAVVSGQGAPEAVNVQVYRDRTLVQETPTQIPADGGSRQVQVELNHPDVGIFTYQVVVPPLPGESNTNDNYYAVKVQVIDARNRLLYVEGAPRWESKYMKRALQANKKVTPLIFLHGPGGKPISFGPVGSMTADMTENQLSFFKVVMLGNLDADEIGDARARNLIKYVDDGGSLVLLGGADAWGPEGFASSPLRKILPVRRYSSKPRLGEFPVVLTDEGQSHPAFAGDRELWEMLPPILAVFPVSELSPAAQNLVVAQTEDGDMPVVVSQPYGQGKVVAVFTDSLWKWKLHFEAVEMRPYQRFWDQMVSWLLPEEDDMEKDQLSLFTDREELVLGDEIRISARVGDDATEPPSNVRCEIELPDGKQQPFAMRSEPVTTSSGKTYPGFATTFKGTEPGLHSVVATATIAGRKVTSEPLSFFVKPFSAESIPRGVNAEVLKRIAESSGAAFYKDPEELADALTSLRFEVLEEESSAFKSLWNTWFVIVILTLLVSAAWIVRKMNNMP